MADGTNSGTGLTLQTQSITVKECVFIISILIYKFNIKCSIHMQRNQPTIYIHSKSIKQIKPNILHYFLFLGDISYKSIKLKVFFCLFSLFNSPIAQLPNCPIELCFPVTAVIVFVLLFLFCFVLFNHII
jgi:LAGLIDADG DNA endonuclease family